MVILFLLMNITCTGHNCPDNLASEVFSCLNILTLGNNKNILTSTTNVDLMNQNCRSGAFTESVQCLERLLNRCKQPQAKEWLGKLARPKRWEAGFQRLCKHIHLYDEKKHCIQKQNCEVEGCVKRKNAVFFNIELISNKHHNHSVDIDVMKSICSVFHLTDECLIKSFRLSCGEPVSAIIRDFNGAITPPVCIGFEAYMSSSPSNQKYVTHVISSTLICLVLLYFLRF